MESIKPALVRIHDVKLDDDYIQWIQDVKQRFRKTQIKAAVKVNSEQLLFNWQLGRDLVIRKAEEKWGSGIVEQVSLDLQAAFPDVKGFSARNLWNMKKWYSFYAVPESTALLSDLNQIVEHDQEKLQQVAAEIPSEKLQQVVTEYGVFLISQSDVEAYYQYYHPQVLRFDAKTRVGNYHAVNFGACKGETFERVLIYPNGPLADFVIRNKALGSPEKYYVGITRPKYSIAIVLKAMPEVLNGYQEVALNCGDSHIRSLEFIVKRAN